MTKEEKAADVAFKVADKYAVRNCKPGRAVYSELVKAVRYGIAWQRRHQGCLRRDKQVLAWRRKCARKCFTDWRELDRILEAKK